MKISKTGKMLPLAVCMTLMLTASLLFGCQAQTKASVEGYPSITATATSTAHETSSPSPTTAGTAQEAVQTYAITLDVNPSIELTVVNGLVTKVTAYNDDAKQLLLNVDVAGLKPADAIKKLVDALAAGGYINNTEIKPYLIIGVTDAAHPEAGLADSLKHVAHDTLDSLHIDCKVKIANISPDIAAKAEALGISASRYAVFDYISKKEGITIEQAMAKYGALKVADLMRLYDDMDKIFKGDDDDGDEDKKADAALTPEQQAIFDAALTVYRAEIKSAEKTYVKAKNEAITNLKTQWTALKAQYKGNRNAAEFKQAKKVMRENYKALRKQIHDAFKKAVESAQAKFKAAVSSLNLTDKQLDKLMDYHVKGDAGDDSDKYMTDEENDDKGGSSGNQNDRPKATANPGKANGKPAGQKDDARQNDKGGKEDKENKGDKKGTDHKDEGRGADKTKAPSPTHAPSNHGGDNEHEGNDD